MKKILIVLLITLVFTSLAFGERNIDAERSLNKSTQVSDYLMDVNRLECWYRNNSVFAYNYLTADFGTVWPRGSGNSPIFAAGMWVGAKYGDEVRVAATQHDASEFQPGQVVSPHVAANRLDPAFRWYIVTPAGGADYPLWPVDQGAPLNDLGNPMVLGDETAFAVFNDLGQHNTFQSNKLSVEIQQTVFAYNRADALGDMNFMKWVIVNKSDVDWDSTFLSIWVDPDIGYGYDDFVGCDENLGLGYCYNATNEDQNYGGAPPASGYDFFQGPIIDAPGETVELPDGTVVNDKTMLGMTGFIYYSNNPGIYGNPYNSNDVWNFMTSHWKDGSLITNDGGPGTGVGPPATFMFNGDPEAGTGWLDSNESDRRFLETVGPFTMPVWDDENGNGLAEFGEPGVQIIVAGQLVARGTSNVNSVTELKSVDVLAQMAYDLNFVLARAPSSPVVVVTELPNEIILTWDNSSEFDDQGAGTMPTLYESIDPIITAAMGDSVILDNVQKVVDDDTYNFLGYAAYQYSDASGSDPVQLRSWTVPEAANPTRYEGDHFLRITANTNTMVGDVGAPLYNGKEYYFGVKAIAYCEYGGPTHFDSPHAIVTALPTFTSGERYNTTYHDTLTTDATHTNLVDPRSDATVAVRVIDRNEITGHDYTVWFNEQQYYRDANGIWLPALANTKMLNKSSDVSSSTLSVVATVPEPGSPAAVSLEFALALVSPNGAWVDGVEVTLPAGINIVQVDDLVGAGGGPGSDTPTVVGQTVTFGANILSEWGHFASGETFVIWVDMFTAPIDINFTIWDDGWAPGATGIVDAVGIATVTEIAFATETGEHWNVRDNVTGLDVVEDHLDLYPGGIGDAAPVFDGVQVIVDGSFAAPHGFILEDATNVEPTSSIGLGPDGEAQGYYEIDGYGVHNWSYGVTTSSRAYYALDDPGEDPLPSGAWGYGTEDLNTLVQDYELRMTGVWGDTLGATADIASGGQRATLIRTRSMVGGTYGLETHPMNPNPGVDAAFTVGIPFEVWNTTTGEQVNYCLIDRLQEGTETPVWGFNPHDRMYCFILNTPYNTNVNSPFEDATLRPSLTWNNIWWVCHHVVGDVLTLQYANPIVKGSDTFDFTTAGLEPVTTAATLEDDVENINVVPNPYYGYHSGEMNPFDRWVQFTNLPETCTIRIFDLSGTLVRFIEKDDDSTVMQWNLSNEYLIPVASGVYVYHVETPSGDKVGKMAIFMPNERIDTY